MGEEEEFEEFEIPEDDDEEVEEEIPIVKGAQIPPMPARKLPPVPVIAKKAIAKPVVKPEPEPEQEVEEEEVQTVSEEPVAQQTQPQYVGVPRVVSIEEMLNNLYDGQQEMKQALAMVLEKIK